jgi:iron(III) transport system ATP-binding protein
MSGIQILDANKGFGAGPVLDHLDLDIPEGSVTAILGASGSGKTTLLRLIAGFDRLDHGVIRIGGRIIDDGARVVRAQHRGIGFVPQDAGLFPHLTVIDNIGFGLPRTDRARVGELLEMVGLAGFEVRRPHQLSGGQQQRVALARALAIRPTVLLLDEPFAALDASLRASLRQDVSRILADSGTTAILVTHDQDEALSLADQVAVLEGGVLRGSGPPRDLYDRPDNAVVAARIGDANLLRARIDGTLGSTVLGPVSLGRAYPGTGAVVVVRPEQIIVHETPERGAMPAIVDRFEFYGHDAVAHVTLQDPERTRVTARMAGSRTLIAAQPVWVAVSGSAYVLDTAGVQPARTVTGTEGPAAT